MSAFSKVLLGVGVAGLILAANCKEAKAEDYFSYSAKHFVDHKLLHIGLSATWESVVCLSEDAYGPRQSVWVNSAIGLAPGIAKEVYDMSEGERLDYALGDIFIFDLAGVLVGQALTDILFPNPKR